MSTYNLTVGKIPHRKGVWLGIQEDSGWTPVAKFRNEQAAQLFVTITKEAGLHRDEHE